MKNIVNFIFETSNLKRMPRTGWYVLGVGGENIAEHAWHATVIGYVLAYLAKADVSRVVKMLIIHDIPEVRTGDINKLQSIYLRKDEQKLIFDQSKNLPFGKEYRELIKEYTQKRTTESKLAHDADILSLLVRLKELVDSGNKQAKKWFEANSVRLRTKQGKAVFATLKKIDSQDWWADIRKKVYKDYKNE